VLSVEERAPGVIASAVASHESTGYADVTEALRKGYAQSGYANAWRQANAVLLAKHNSDPGVAMIAARRYAMAGDAASALPLLERADEERNPSMPHIGCLPIFDPLRAGPRFQALLRRMNLPL
jgi:hypothetical protein